MATGAVVIGDRVRVPSDVFELDRFRAWAHSDEFPTTGRISFLAGEVDVDMSPEEIESHNKVKTALTADLFLWNRKSNLGEVFSDGTFFVNESCGLATEPDLMFCSWQNFKNGSTRLREWAEGSNRFVELAGSPDLVVEVVSRSSVRKDTKVLFDLYFQAGVLEYWLIDARGIEIDFRLLTRRTKQFGAVVANEDGFVHSSVLGGDFRLTRSQNELGRFDYSLESN